MVVRPVHGISLCAGGGGLDLGLEIAIPGYRTVCYVEREVYAASVLVARMAEEALCEAPVWDDITTFDGKPWRGVVHLISAGDPCQPWSNAGQRKGYDDERVVFDDVARIVGEVEPEFVFLENVAGAIDFRYDCKAVLEGMGYRVEAGLFSAAEVGAPHGRLRIFLLAQSQGELGLREAGNFRETDGRQNDELLRVGRSASCELAHNDKRRCEQWTDKGERTPGRQRDKRESASFGGELPLWPPRPNNLEAWRDILQRWPEVEPSMAVSENGQDGQAGIKHEECDREGSEVEPSIRRMADWTTYRVERLQLLGNAVVPLTAALAFATLHKRLIRDKEAL